MLYNCKIKRKVHKLVRTFTSVSIEAGRTVTGACCVIQDAARTQAWWTTHWTYIDNRQSCYVAYSLDNATVRDLGSGNYQLLHVPSSPTVPSATQHRPLNTSVFIIIIIIIIKNEKIRVTLCENAAGALYIVIVNMGHFGHAPTLTCEKHN